MVFIMYWECMINMIRKLMQIHRKIILMHGKLTINCLTSFVSTTRRDEKHPELKVTCYKKGECDSDEK